MNTNPHTAALLAALRNIVDHDGQHIQAHRLHAAVVAIQDAEQSIAVARAESAQSATKDVADNPPAKVEAGLASKVPA